MGWIPITNFERVVLYGETINRGASRPERTRSPDYGNGIVVNVTTCEPLRPTTDARGEFAAPDFVKVRPCAGRFRRWAEGRHAQIADSSREGGERASVRVFDKGRRQARQPAGRCAPGRDGPRAAREFGSAPPQRSCHPRPHSVPRPGARPSSSGLMTASRSAVSKGLASEASARPWWPRPGRPRVETGLGPVAGELKIAAAGDGDDAPEGYSARSVRISSTPSSRA